MKQVTRSMAGILLAGLVTASLLAFVSSFGLLPYLGQKMDTPSEGFAGYQDLQQLKAVCKRKPPEIIRKSTKRWKPGEEIFVSQVFEGRDEDGRSTRIEVVEIQDGDGNSRICDYSKQEQKIVLKERGVYRVGLKAVDSQCKTSYRQFLIVVETRMELSGNFLDKIRPAWENG